MLRGLAGSISQPREVVSAHNVAWKQCGLPPIVVWEHAASRLREAVVGAGQ